MLVDVFQAVGRLSIWCSRVECCRNANLRQGLGVLLSSLDGSLTFFLMNLATLRVLFILPNLGEFSSHCSFTSILYTMPFLLFRPQG